MANVLSHNERAATVWGSGGRDYDRISESISDALAHLVSRIAPQTGERFLDVATGTGSTARLLASHGAAVTGIDIGAGVIEAAKALAPVIDFRIGDAEALPFEDASFDAVTSTCGVMFVAQPEVAARELARVCKKGGRLGLVALDARRGSRAYLPDNAALYAPTARKSTTLPLYLGSPGAHPGIARRRFRTAVRNRHDDIADARRRVGLGAFRQWLRPDQSVGCQLQC